MGSENIKRAKVSAKGWVVIPSSLRRRYRLNPGTFVEFKEEGDRILIIPSISDPVEHLYGRLAGKASLTKTLLKNRDEDLKREETKLRTG